MFQDFVLSCIAPRDQESSSTNQPKQPNQSFVENKKEDTVDLDKFISDGTKNNTMIRLDGDLEYTPIRCSKAKLRGLTLEITDP